MSRCVMDLKPFPRSVISFCILFIFICLVTTNGGSIPSDPSRDTDSTGDNRSLHINRKLSIGGFLSGLLSGKSITASSIKGNSTSNTTQRIAGGGSIATITKSGNTLTDDSYAHLTREQCQAKYGRISFYKPTERRLPPMLYTYPGSGNTWARLLIEYSTNIYSGSVYDDSTLLQALPGEFKCNWEVSVVKIHPHTHPFEGLRTGKFNSDHEKCKKGDIRSGFEKGILLIRDPFDSIWSEYQRRLTQSHVKGLKKNEFDWNRWQANAAAMANSYFSMWDTEYMGIEKHFPETNYVYVKYEHLKSKPDRVAALTGIRDFVLNRDVGKRTVATTDNSTMKKKSAEHIECAFTLAENPQAHRRIDPSQKELYMTKDIAYTKELTCRMWSLFGKYASKHGYKSRNFDCSDKEYPPVPKLNVGSQGEYNYKWVKPGEELIDFGGYDTKEYPTRDQLDAMQRQRDKDRVSRPRNKKNKNFKKRKSGKLGSVKREGLQDDISGMNAAKLRLSRDAKGGKGSPRLRKNRVTEGDRETISSLTKGEEMARDMRGE